jgi:nitric oxide reductase subunit B
MKRTNLSIGKLFLLTALVMLLLGLIFGVLSTVSYLVPDFLKDTLGFTILRPLHVSSAVFWIILGATGCVYCGLQFYTDKELSNRADLTQWVLWIIALAGIFYSYFTKSFGGREYWEFNPIWALPIAIAWIIFLVNFIKISKKIKDWPVYVWMWLTGIIFFLFTFIENYLWVFPYFREHFVTDMTVQWKVNGSLVGSWNQILYGTAFFLMDKFENNKNVGRSKLAFGMFFLGLFNLMFNWGHHIYTLPTEQYIRYVGYAVSMTEWIFFVRIIYTWKQTVSDIQKHYHYFPYRFIIAADIWVFINMGQAILMSIPAINLYTHGTHITVSHAMGTTIGINSMIIFAACFEFFDFKRETSKIVTKLSTLSFWFLQFSLLIFWLSLIMAGIKKSIWQMSENQSSYSKMMVSLTPYFTTFFVAGLGLLISFTILAIVLIKTYWKNRFIIQFK